MINPLLSAGDALHSAFMTILTHTRLWRFLFTPAPETYPAHALFVALSDAARNPFFYSDAAVADTLDGRFDMLVVHLFLTLERLRSEPESEALQRALLECFFSSLDRSLREMGVADLGVGRRIRKMADAAKGRLTRYLKDWPEQESRLRALTDNVYRGDTDRASQGGVALLEQLAQFEQELADTPYAALLKGTWGKSAA
jgi:cytochrome b pre-mRNA-processing protein 3